MAYGFGISVFGSKDEFTKLTQFTGQYTTEFENYKKELFYS
jgi:hypothetical protein